MTANGVSRDRFARAIGTIGFLWEPSPLGPVHAVPIHRHRVTEEQPVNYRKKDSTPGHFAYYLPFTDKTALKS